MKNSDVNGSKAYNSFKKFFSYISISIIFFVIIFAIFLCLIIKKRLLSHQMVLLLLCIYLLFVVIYGLVVMMKWKKTFELIVIENINEINNKYFLLNDNESERLEKDVIYIENEYLFFSINESFEKIEITNVKLKIEEKVIKGMLHFYLVINDTFSNKTLLNCELNNDLYNFLLNDDNLNIVNIEILYLIKDDSEKLVRTLLKIK